MINVNENQVHNLNETIGFGVTKPYISDAIADMGISDDIPVALQKMTDKIERSSDKLLVSHGSGQARRSLVVE